MPSADGGTGAGGDVHEDDGTRRSVRRDGTARLVCARTFSWRQRKLVGVDVIHVHRLLKNPVDVPEYVLVSDELHRGGATALSGPAMQEIAQNLEGIGPVRTSFVNVEDSAAPLASLPDPSWPRRIGSTVGMVGRGLP